MTRFGIACALLLVSGRAAASILDDPRLSPARPQLDRVFAAATRDGVPESILSDKLNEGLAKGVPAARIALVVSALEGSLAEASRQAAAHFSQTPLSLLKAMVATRSSGATAGEVDTLLKAGSAHGTGAVTRALDVVSDLGQRGFPSAVATRVVTVVLSKSPRDVERIPTEAQTLLSRKGVSRADALDAIARAASQGLSVDRAGDTLGHDPPGLEDKDHGPNRETSGQRGPGNGKANGHL